MARDHLLPGREHGVTWLSFLSVSFTIPSQQLYGRLYYMWINGVVAVISEHCAIPEKMTEQAGLNMSFSNILDKPAVICMYVVEFTESLFFANQCGKSHRLRGIEFSGNFQ